MKLKNRILLILLLSLPLHFTAYAMEQDKDDEPIDSTEIRTEQEPMQFLDLPLEKIIDINNFLKPLPTASAEQILASFEDILALSQSCKHLQDTLENEIIRHIKKNLDQYKTITNFENDNLLSLALKEKKYKIASLFLRSSITDEFQLEKMHPDQIKMFFAWAITNGYLNIAQICLAWIPDKIEAANMHDNKRSLLHLASVNSNEDCIELLLKNGAYVNPEDNQGNIPLDFAARHGNIGIVKLLVSYGANLNHSIRGKYYTAIPLIYAIRYHKIEVVKFLLNNGAEINSNSANANDFTPIEVALIASNATDRLNDEIIVSLLSHGAHNTSFKSIVDKGSALFLAAAFGFITGVKRLLEEGADLAAKNDLGWTPLFTATVYGHVDIVKLLIDSGANVASKSNVGTTVLLKAIDEQNHQLCELFSEYKELINEPNNDLISPLHGALKTINCNFNIIKLLIDSGANTNFLDSNSDSPLLVAVTSSTLSSRTKYKTIKYLVQNGADVNFVGSNNDSILMSMISDRNNFDLKTYYKATKFLIKNGADVNFCRTSDKETPLMIVVFLNKPDIVHLLIKNGADVNSANKLKKTAFDIAKQNNCTEIIQLLTEAKKRGQRAKQY